MQNNNTDPSNNKDPFKIIFVLIFLAMTLGSFTHCVIEPPKSATKKNARSTSSVSQPTSTDVVSGTGDPLLPSPSDPSPLVGGELFFEEVVKANFENNCMACHADPSTNPPLPGPLSIYNYDQMKVKLLNGSSGTQNELIQKIQDIIGHAGGNRCPNGLTDSVCQVVTDWYQQESQAVVTPDPTPTPVPTPDPVTGVTGMVSVVTSQGKVTGYAGDTTNTSKTMGVNFYADGPSGAGDLLNDNPVQANLPGFNGGISGNHAFNFYIPFDYRDGFSHTLHVYAVENGEETELQGSPYTFTAYTSTVEGFNYYLGTVKPLLDNRCSSCHAFSYDQNFGSLLTPSPANGGSMVNNEMINMPSGSNMGVSHPGGNICGSKDNSPCVEIQRWWELEFN